MMKKNKISIYIHIPFCRSRCHYCDFCSSVIDKKQVEKYIKYLKKEIHLYKGILEGREISTIFIGGGTPSSIDEIFIGQILEEFKNFNFSKDIEITIEANPNSLSLEKLKKYRNFNINRISIGAQSFNNKILKTIGRIHNKEEIFKTVKKIKEAGFTNFNIDLMLALPYQTLKDIEESVEILKILNPNHISYYSLIIEDNTNIKKLYDKNSSLFPSENMDRKMYHYLVDNLEKIGYNQYEISNFAKKSFECKHNLSYWTLKDYLGFGLSASSNIRDKRFTNTCSFSSYYKSLDKEKKPIDFSEILSKKDRMNEFSIMGIRLNSGIDTKNFEEIFSTNFFKYYEKEIDKHIKDGLIEVKEDKICLSKKGRDLSNIVEVDFIK
ncbi:MAG: radical SAM family heme chaperone HemW [Peptoniphilus lacrimalis]